MERALLARVYGISDPTVLGDAQYVDGLRTAVSAAIDYAYAALRAGEEHAPAIPGALLVQARLAAQNGIDFDIVVRRYVAGFALLSDFVLQEVDENESVGAAPLRALLHSHASLLDRLLDALSEEHRRAREERNGESRALRRLERVRRLLDGELLDTTDLRYGLDCWHLGVLGTGPDAGDVLAGLAAALDRVALVVQPDRDTTWAWLGGRGLLDPERVMGELREADSSRLRFAVGEPGEGVPGWRLSHRQAAAALPIAQRGDQTPVRYADVALLSTVLQDDLLADSLRTIYLQPLEDERDGGAALRKTLRAYLATNGSLSSAASILGVSRRTVSNRIARFEEILERPLHAALADIDTALRMDELVSTP